MTKTEQIKAIAVLDGWNQEPEATTVHDHVSWGFSAQKPKWWHLHQLPPYLTSYDAILPVIQKQDLRIRDKLSTKIKWEYGTTVSFLFPLLITPYQLCQALLRATGKGKNL